MFLFAAALPLPVAVTSLLSLSVVVMLLDLTPRSGRAGTIASQREQMEKASDRHSKLADLMVQVAKQGGAGPKGSSTAVFELEELAAASSCPYARPSAGKNALVLYV